MAVRKKKAQSTKSSAGKAKKATGGRSVKRSGGASAKKKPKKKAKPSRGSAKAAKRSRPEPKKKAARAKAKAKPSRAQQQAEARREKARKDKEKALERREKEREKAQLEKERAKAKAEKERDKARKEKEKERERKEKERERKEKERERKEKEREKARLEKERAKAKAEQEKAKAKEQAAKEAERKRQLAEKEAQKEAERRAKQAEKQRIKAEKEAERLRVIAEKEAQREAIRKAKEEEKAKRDAEREAYRLAKEAERERLRAEKEAARRLREGKIARATKNSNRDGLRMASARVYDPAAIPNQSGTTRRGIEQPIQRLVGVRLPDYPLPGTGAAAAAAVSQQIIPPPPPPISSPVAAPAPAPLAPVAEPRLTPLPPSPELIEERFRLINERLSRADESFKRQYDESFEMSWIHHDSALEGVVYTFQELKTAMDPTVTVVPDSSMQPVCEEIRRHRQAIAYVRELGERKRVPINVDVMKKIYVILHPEEGDIKTVKYRKDIPQHRLYFHEYAPPDKIAYRVRQVLDWLNGPEPKKIKNPIRVAARVHYDLVRIFPFPQDSGKVARLLMNVLLLRSGYPPAIIHSTERQRYYEALKGQLPIIFMLVNESISNALMSIEKLLDEHETRNRF